MELNSFESLLSEGMTARGSKAGREKGLSQDSDAVFNPKKSKVKIFRSIYKGLANTKFGEIWSTDKANRLYVTSELQPGSQPQGPNRKSAKGFTPGSSNPPASWKRIKQFAVDTMRRHGADTSKTHHSGSKSYKNEGSGGAARLGRKYRASLKKHGPEAEETKELGKRAHLKQQQGITRSNTKQRRRQLASLDAFIGDRDKSSGDEPFALGGDVTSHRTSRTQTKSEKGA